LYERKIIINKKKLVALLTDELITHNMTHEIPPPGRDCGECGVSLDAQIAARNPFFSPMRSGGKKHKRCMDCWKEYIIELSLKILKGS